MPVANRRETSLQNDDKMFDDMDEMLNSIGAQMPMLSSESFYVLELERQSRIFGVIAILGIIMILTSLLVNLAK